MRAARLLLMTCGLLGACDDTTFGAGEGGFDTGPTCDSTDDKAVFVMQTLAFAEADDGVVWGFDLDDHVTELGDSQGCGKGDMEDPEGTPGIDNAFAGLLPALENTEAVAIKGLLQNAVDAGELLVMLEVLGLDDPVDDDCVSVRFSTAVGDPMIGTDGTMLDGQSFAHDPESIPILMEDVVVEDGVLVAEGLSILLELQILDAPLALAVDEGALRIALDEDLSGAVGHFGGGFSIDYVMEVVDGNAVDDTLTELLRTALPLAADIDSDEAECSHMSVALEYTAIPAFFYGE